MADEKPVAPTAEDFGRLSRDRLDDAKCLLTQKRYEGGAYVCGYAVEMALKARICKTLKWSAYPSSKGDYRCFFTHELDLLLTLTGMEKEIRTECLKEWSAVLE